MVDDYDEQVEHNRIVLGIVTVLNIISELFACVAVNIKILLSVLY